MRVLVIALALGIAIGTAGGQPDPDTLAKAEAFAKLVWDSRPDVPPSDGAVAGADAFIDAGRGPVPVFVPADYDPDTPTPLIILLHGYMNNGQEVEDWWQLASLVDEYGFLYAYPTGTTDLFGFEFWNATDACCNLFGSSVNDSAYLANVVAQMQATYNVDPRQIHFAGHSNGGFMSYRMACDHADMVASIVSLSGATYQDPADCTPANPVHTLEIHGTADGVISYNGGCIPLGGCYPGAVQTAQTWAAYNGCSTTGQPQPGALDIDASIAGAETQVTWYHDGCDEGGSTELWTVNGGPHSPNLTADFNRMVVEYLLSHPKPGGCTGDVDGSGAVDTVDFLALLGAWGPNPGHPADLDGSGFVDTVDFLALLGAWGPCP